MLSDTTKRFLLIRARLAIAARLGHGKENGDPIPAEAQSLGAAFVSLHTMGASHSLRGCIGTFSFAAPLADTVRAMALAAAFEDPRFPPLAASELLAVSIEISALTPPQVIAPSAVIVGQHGLVLARGTRRGVLLPQVAVEWGWDVPQFLSRTCEKAGLAQDAWREPGTRIEAFEAEVFSEPVASAGVPPGPFTDETA